MSPVQAGLIFIWPVNFITFSYIDISLQMSKAQLSDGSPPANPLRLNTPANSLRLNIDASPLKDYNKLRIA